jgi:hypothetical protein
VLGRDATRGTGWDCQHLVSSRLSFVRDSCVGVGGKHGKMFGVPPRVAFGKEVRAIPDVSAAVVDGTTVVVSRNPALLGAGRHVPHYVPSRNREGTWQRAAENERSAVVADWPPAPSASSRSSVSGGTESSVVYRSAMRTDRAFAASLSVGSTSTRSSTLIRKAGAAVATAATATWPWPKTGTPMARMPTSCSSSARA